MLAGIAGRDLRSPIQIAQSQRQITGAEGLLDVRPQRAVGVSRERLPRAAKTGVAI
jgi:hypothetical protein